MCVVPSGAALCACTSLVNTGQKPSTHRKVGGGGDGSGWKGGYGDGGGGEGEGGGGEGGEGGGGGGGRGSGGGGRGVGGGGGDGCRSYRTPQSAQSVP